MDTETAGTGSIEVTFSVFCDTVLASSLGADSVGAACSLLWLAVNCETVANVGYSSEASSFLSL